MIASSSSSSERASEWPVLRWYWREPGVNSDLGSDEFGPVGGISGLSFAYSSVSAQQAVRVRAV